MKTAKPVQFVLTPEFANYFEAINLHMQVHYHPELILPTKSFVDQPVNGHNDGSALSTTVDDAQLEVQLVAEMMEQVRLIEQALFIFGENSDPKKIELGQDVQNSFNELWSENLSVVIKAIEFLKTIFKDVHRYWPYLEGQMDRLVMACARVIGLMFTRYKSSLFVNAHDATRAPIINLLNSTAQLFHSIILKSPLLPSKISSETYSTLFESLMPYNLLITEESENLDPRVQSKVQSVITNMLSMSELNNLLLALLQKINAKLNEYNQDPTQHVAQLNILIKWMEKLGCYLSDTKVSSLNLDLILNEADMLIRYYPGSVFENSRDYRLLEAIREIVFKIVEYKGDPGIWDHLMMVDLDKGDSGLIKYINIALERHQVFQVLKSNSIEPDSDAKNKPKINLQLEDQLCEYKPIAPAGLKLPEQNDDDVDVEIILDPELVMFEHWLNNLANTSEMLQAKLSLDYLNQNFDDIVSKFAKSLEPQMDLLIRSCTRQYHLFTILYYPPNVGQPSSQSLQMLHATTSLLKRIFTSTISLKSVSNLTMSNLILLIFSLRLSWSADFSLEVLTQLESSILTNDSLNKCDLICICIRVLRYEQMYTSTLSCSTFGEIQRFATQMLTELTLPIHFVTYEMISEQYDLNAMLFEINAYLLTFDGQPLEESFDRFLKKEDRSERVEDNRPLSVIEQLIYDIAHKSGYHIYDYIDLMPEDINDQLERFIYSIIENLDSFNNKTNDDENDKNEQNRRFPEKVPQTVLNQLDEFQNKVLPEFRSQNNFRIGQAWVGQRLSWMIANYESFARYPLVSFSAIDSLTEACTYAMIYMVNYTEYPDRVNQTDLMSSFKKIGELLLKMYGNSDSVGHEYVTMINLRKLIQANIGMLLMHANRSKEYVYPEFHWIWDLQYALTCHSKPYYLLPLALESFNALLTNVLDFEYVQRSTRTNYLLACLLNSMLDVSCGQMFLYPTAIYTPQMGTEKFDVRSFFKQVDDLFNYYPMSYLEEERDYKILVLFQRVLHRLYEHHGLLMKAFWAQSSLDDLARSPVWKFFQHLIVQNSGK